MEPLKEMLVFARHTQKWEFAHQEETDETEPSGETVRYHWWVRRDFSMICQVGDEVATLPVPDAPR